MQAVSRSPAFIKKRNFLMMLPLLILPFIVILFYILGGGKMKSSAFEEKQTGLNLQLPDAHFFKKKEPDKLGLYEASKKDSDNRRMALRNDPYREDSLKAAPLGVEKSGAIKNIFEKTAERFPEEEMGTKKPLSGNERTSDAKEKELIEKLNKLKEHLNGPDQSDTEYRAKVKGRPENQELKMAELLSKMNGENEPDPEMSQLNKMLDKVMAIQHPESIPDSLKKQSQKYKTKVYLVNAAVKEQNISCLERNKSSIETDSSATDLPSMIQVSIGFYGLDEKPADENTRSAIAAVIPETQVLVSGSTVKLRLTSEILVNGVQIPKDEFIYGTASLSNDRLKITINSIQYEDNLLPVSLSAYNLDGMEGLYIPGSISRDAAKQSADQAINGLGLETLDPSLGAQATGAGIQMAKSLIGKKVKLIRITVPAGYHILLKDSNQK